MDLLGLALGLLVGLSLGLLGGGGSILTVPILAYVLGFPPKEAIAMSLAIVGATALFGAASHWRVGNVRIATALLFGLVAMAGTYLGARLSVFFAGTTQLVLFAVVMLAASWFMFRGPPARSASRPRRGGPASPDRDSEESTRSGAEGAGWSARRVGLLVAEGLGVGVLTGLVGVGGGFLIVPALVLLAGLPMKEAVGTSLLVIALKSAAGFYGYLALVDVPWDFLALFTGIACLGILVGAGLVRFFSQEGLRRAFAGFLVVMAAWILYQNRTVWLPETGAADLRAVQSSGEPERGEPP